MKFDGYGATIEEFSSVFSVVDCIAEALETNPEKGPSIRRFGQTTAFNVGPRMAAWMGIDPTSGAIYIEGKGETTPALVEAIRTSFPSHGAPRLDVCDDYDEPGAFGRLVALVRSAKGSRVKSGYVALPDDVEDGCTWAAGRRGGVGYIRVYEAGKHPDRVHLGRPHWVRSELEARPHYARDKRAAARMSPVEVWGLCAWTHSVGERLMGCQINRFEPEARRYSADKTTLYIARTFRRHLEEMQRNGEDVMRTFRSIWEDDDNTPRVLRH